MSDRSLEDQILLRAVERGILTRDDLKQVNALLPNPQLQETLVDTGHRQAVTLVESADPHNLETMVDTGHRPALKAVETGNLPGQETMVDTGHRNLATLPGTAFQNLETVVDTGIPTLAEENPWGSRIDYFIKEGRLTVSDVATISQDLNLTAPPKPTNAGATRKPRGVSQTLSYFVQELREKKAVPGHKGEFPVVEWDRYEFIKLIGEGGMGVVYQARDRRLDRLVALKFIRGGDKSLHDRFIQEARSQSRIQHPNICKVFEVGDVEGMPYIAMQYLEGESLLKARKSLNLEEQIRIVKEVAEALHAAHRIGIIHRDVKPANIMVERAADGQLVPVVMDFGLARDSAAQSELTQNGMIVGTPAYMSPEQAAGDLKHLDRRTDVYSLGAMLFDLLTGRPPFEAVTPMQVVLKVLNEEPPSLEKLAPKIPKDLVTITLKCMEKDPTRRYESAQALARDLRAYLDGEPVSAQQVTWQYWVRKKARKNKALVAISTLTLLVVGLLAIETVRTRWIAEAQTKYAIEFGERALKIEADLRPAYMLPLHDIRPERAAVVWQLNRISLRMQEGGRVAQGPGNYAMGRGYLALHDFRRARTHLEKATQLGFETPEVAYALGRVMGELFREEINEVERVSNRELRELRRQELESAFLLPALHYLDQYVKTGDGLQSRDADYIEGLVAFYRKDYTKAIAQAEETVKVTPWMFEGCLLKGDALTARALQLRDAGQFQAALDTFAQAETEYMAAMKIAPSAEIIYGREASRSVQCLLLEVSQGHPIETPYQKALESCNQAIRINSESYVAWTLKARSLFRWGEYLADRGDDPRQTLAESIECANQALRFEPMDVNALNTIGNAYHRLGVYENTHGVDPRASFTKATDHFRKGMGFSTQPSVALNNLGNVYRDTALYEMWHGIDPHVAFQKGIDCFEEAILKNPGYSLAHNNLGAMYENLGFYQFKHGDDPTLALDKATVNLKKSIELNPKSILAHGNLGHVSLTFGEYRLAKGQDPTPNLNEARAAYQKSLEIRPEDGWVQLEQAKVEILTARWAMRQNQVPEPFFTEAAALLETAQKNKAEVSSAALVGAELALRQAEVLLARQQNPETELNKGMELTQKALAVNSELTGAVALQGALLLVQAQSLSNPSAQAQIAGRAQVSLEKALKNNSMLKLEYDPLLKQAQYLANGGNRRS